MPGAEKAAGFKLTGWHVLAMLIGVFAIVFAVNGYMVHVAFKTMRGIDTRNAYERGVHFEQEVDEAKLQAERHWGVDIVLRPGAGPDRAVTVTVTDKDKHPLPGMKATLMLTHPTNAGKDQSVTLIEANPGVFGGAFSADAGKWYVQLTLSDSDGKMLFRSRNTTELQ